MDAVLWRCRRVTSRIHLSKADVSEIEEGYVLDALRSGWVAPLGPHVDAFEAEVAERVGVKHALALSSGTAALHLALLGLGARPGTAVVCPSMTFVASANAIAYTGASPVFVDSDPEDGNVDSQLLITAIDTLRAQGVLVVAALVVDLFGRCADYAAMIQELNTRGVPLLEDAAEALGSTYGGAAAGSFGVASVLSFNGNKILTTSGGGMLLSDDWDFIDRARYLSAQARQPVPWYEHAEIGYNYRLSNVLAALGRGQLTRLDQMITRRGEIRARYRAALADIPGVRILGDTQSHGRVDNGWLTCLEIDSSVSPMSATELIAKLGAEDIESRHLWKPLHLQQSFSTARAFVSGQAEELFLHGLALPSGSSLTDDEVSRVLDGLRGALS